MERFNFRYWNEEEKKMDYRIYVSQEAFLSSETKNPFKILDDNYIAYNPRFCYKNLMQCTGIKDKKGKLIYEGDLFKVKDKTLGNETRLLQCVYDESRCGFDIYQVCTNDPIFAYMDEFMGCYELSKEFPTLEIVGNIYENPELLEEDKNDK